MKKTIITLIAMTAGLVCLAQQQINIGEAYTMIADANNGTASVTNYVGFARVTENTSATPSTNSAVWKIIRTKLDANGLIIEKKHAYGTGTGDQALFTTAWTNRVAATYK